MINQDGYNLITYLETIDPRTESNGFIRRCIEMMPWKNKEHYWSALEVPTGRFDTCLTRVHFLNGFVNMIPRHPNQIPPDQRE